MTPSEAQTEPRPDRGNERERDDAGDAKAWSHSGDTAHTGDPHELAQVQPFVDRSSARAFQRDVFFYWSAARDQPLSLTKQDRLYRKDLRRVNAALLQSEPLEGSEDAVWSGVNEAAAAFRGPRSGRGPPAPAKDEPDFPRLLFLRLLMTELGLLTRRKRTIEATEQPSFLALEPKERVRRAFAHWQISGFWNEILSIPYISVREVSSRTDPAPIQIAHARQHILGFMADEHHAHFGAGFGEHGTPWMGISQLVDRVRQENYGFLFPRDASQSVAQRSALDQVNAYRPYLSLRSPYISYGNPMGWSISPPFSDESEGWDVIEAGFIRAILLEPMFWMGLVDIGYIDNLPVAYRLTSAGAWALGVGPAIEIPEQEGRIVVQPNFEIFALDPISDRALAELDEFADRASGERAIKYQLTRESVYRAQRRGWSAKRIIAALERLTRTPDAAQEPLPQNIVRTLEDWQHLHERIIVHRRANLLQAADSDLLARLLQDPAVGSHLVVPARDVEPGGNGDIPAPLYSSAIVARGLGRVEELARALQAAGYPPARTRYQETGTSVFTPVRCLQISPDGQVHIDIALPSICLMKQLDPFVVHDEENDRHYLTQSAVEGAMAAGMSVDEILETLRSVYRGPLPRRIEIQIRAWGHYYGSAAVQTVTLVQIRDPETLEELLSEPEVKDILHRFGPDASKALALVSAEDLEALYKALSARGIDVRGDLE